jgi:predicted  nucleic acid-binding Zn-ribbon protein
VGRISKNDIKAIERVLDHWEGKVSVAALVSEIKKVLGSRAVSRGTFYKLCEQYPGIKQRLNSARERYRESKSGSLHHSTGDRQLDDALKKIQAQKVEIASLKKDIETLREGYLKVAYNAYYEKIRIENLSRPVTKEELQDTLHRGDFGDRVAFIKKPLPPGKLP